jgi:hypothetical protein
MESSMSQDQLGKLVRNVAALDELADNVSQNLHDAYLMESHPPAGYEDEWRTLLLLRRHAIARIQEAVQTHGK